MASHTSDTAVVCFEAASDGYSYSKSFVNRFMGGCSLPDATRNQHSAYFGCSVTHLVNRSLTHPPTQQDLLQLQVQQILQVVNRINSNRWIHQCLNCYCSKVILSDLLGRCPEAQAQAAEQRQQGKRSRPWKPTEMGYRDETRDVINLIMQIISKQVDHSQRIREMVDIS